MGKPIARALLTLLIAGAVLSGIAVLGKWARQSLQHSDRYMLPFTAIECDPPEGGDCAMFLREVQYLSDFPEGVNLLDDDVGPRMQAAFACHPWVESVANVSVSSQRIAVRLRFRKPVLGVRWGGQVRAVDRQGILLPSSAKTDGLPVYNGDALPPTGPAGTPWGDPEVESAARAAAAT